MLKKKKKDIECGVDCSGNSMWKLHVEGADAHPRSAIPRERAWQSALVTAAPHAWATVLPAAMERCFADYVFIVFTPLICM